MSGKINNKKLLAIFLVLSVILVVTWLATSKKSVRTLNTELVRIDTSRISSIHLYPRAESGEEIILDRHGNKWTASMNNISGAADVNSIQRSLSELLNMKTERLVARTQDKWSEYQVDDSLGTRVIINEGKKKTMDLVIGRFNYKPPPGGYQGYGQNQVSGESFVRKTSDDEVYAVDGFLAFSFNQNFNSWRDQTFTRINPSEVSKMVFEYPADSGFIAQQSGTGWLVAGLAADSASMATYLNEIANKRSSNFKDDFQPSAQADYQLTFDGDNMTPLLIRGFLLPDGDIILNSSTNPDSWFLSKRDGLFADIFKRPEDFLPDQII